VPIQSEIFEHTKKRSLSRAKEGFLEVVDVRLRLISKSTTFRFEYSKRDGDQHEDDDDGNEKSVIHIFA